MKWRLLSKGQIYLIIIFLLSLMQVLNCFFSWLLLKNGYSPLTFTHTPLYSPPTFFCFNILNTWITFLKMKNMVHCQHYCWLSSPKCKVWPELILHWRMYFRCHLQLYNLVFPLKFVTFKKQMLILEA